VVGVEGERDTKRGTRNADRRRKGGGKATPGSSEREGGTCGPLRRLRALLTNEDVGRHLLRRE